MSILAEAYDRLFAAYGPQGWWPGESRLEVLVGAVLVQNTAWTNAERSLANLRRGRLLSPARLCDLPREELEERIRPSGPHRVKAGRLVNLMRLIVDHYGGSLDRLLALPTGELRETLLSVNGVGPETADVILLYAAGRPRFVVDAYARRVLQRHGWLDGGESYGVVQRLFESQLPSDTRLFNEYHALLVEVGKERCRPKNPRCDGCPLQTLLPTGGPISRC